MGDSDDEFEDFLKRRKPVFRAPDDMFEPPAELDRVVLRQAREAIQTDRPVRVFRGPRWATPVALAATLVLTFTVVFYAGMPQKHAPVPEVIVQNVAERVEIPEAAAPVAPAPSAANSRAREDADASGTVMVDLATPMMAKRESAAGTAPMAASSPSKSTEIPAWRRDPNTWMAEIERLRNAGDTERAEAELAEYNRQRRAYAVGPDR